MSCEKCRSNEHHTFRREYSRDAKQMGRAMYNMLLNGPLVEKDIRTLVFSCIPDVPDDTDDVVHEPTVGEVML